jgi:Arc/MetJ-type ribon-helix-helix transcriptional regulator
MKCEVVLPNLRITISIDGELLLRLDRLVDEQRFPNRSRAIEDALREKVDRLDRRRLARECEKLDPVVEQQLADKSLAEDFDQWPAY